MSLPLLSRQQITTNAYKQIKKDFLEVQKVTSKTRKRIINANTFLSGTESHEYGKYVNIMHTLNGLEYLCWGFKAVRRMTLT